ncbi:MAG: efflux RND transporter periplasmic adaptor subunit [Gemmatimonadota bacterium]|jgi:multidrug efflux system membrane fusion protein|nr:efflux RND transporter periplasmic adaptor subunit [Gemmatimonadota bacterium]
MPDNVMPLRATRRFAIAPVHRLLAGASLLLVGLSACKENKRPPRPAPVVSTATVKKGPLPFVVTANGQIEPNRTVSVQSLVSGMLTRVAIAEGDEVRQGQVLFQIDPRPFRAEVDRLESTLARDQATLARARGDSVRFAGLAKDGYVTRQQLDQTFAEASALAATVAAGRASLERARLDLENATVKAPISGRTGQITLRAGSLVRAQADPPLLIINELEPVLVTFSVPEQAFEEMRRRAGLDQALSVDIVPNVGDSTRKITGILTFIDNAVDRATGTVLLKARVPNADRALWPGQFVSVGLQLAVDQDAITVPAEAVVATGTGAFVYLVDGGKAKRTSVKVGRQAGTVVKVDSGLVGGEQVIIEGQNRLQDGAKVELRGSLSGGGRTGANGGRSGRGGARGGAGGAADTGAGGGNPRGGTR